MSTNVSQRGLYPQTFLIKNISLTSELRDISSGVPSNGDTLVWNSITNQYEPSTTTVTSNERTLQGTQYIHGPLAFPAAIPGAGVFVFIDAADASTGTIADIKGVVINTQSNDGSTVRNWLTSFPTGAVQFINFRLIDTSEPDILLSCKIGSFTSGPGIVKYSFDSVIDNGSTPAVASFNAGTKWIIEHPFNNELNQTESLINTPNDLLANFSTTETAANDGDIVFLAAGVAVTDPSLADEVRINKQTPQGVTNLILGTYTKGTRMMFRKQLENGVVDGTAIFELGSDASNGGDYFSWPIINVQVGIGSVFADGDKSSIGKFVVNQLKDQGDVSIGVQNNADVLTWNATSEKWESSTLPANLPYTIPNSLYQSIYEYIGPGLSITPASGQYLFLNGAKDTNVDISTAAFLRVSKRDLNDSDGAFWTVLGPQRLPIIAVKIPKDGSITPQGIHQFILPKNYTLTDGGTYIDFGIQTIGFSFGLANGDRIVWNRQEIIQTNQQKLIDDGPYWSGQFSETVAVGTDAWFPLTSGPTSIFASRGINDIGGGQIQYDAVSGDTTAHLPAYFKFVLSARMFADVQDQQLFIRLFNITQAGVIGGEAMSFSKNSTTRSETTGSLSVLYELQPGDIFRLEVRRELGTGVGSITVDDASVSITGVYAN